MPFLILLGTIIGMGVACGVDDTGTPPPIKRRDICWADELRKATGKSQKEVREQLRQLGMM